MRVRYYQLRRSVQAMSSSYWINSGFFTLASKVSIALFGFLSFFILVRALDKETFGVWTLFVALYAVAESVRTAFVYNPLQTFASQAGKGEYATILQASLILNFLFAVVVSILLGATATLLSAAFNAPQLDYLIYIYIITTFVLTGMTHCNFVQSVNLNFRGTFVSTFTRKIIFFGYVLWEYLHDHPFDLISLGIWEGVAALGATGVTFLSAREYLTVSRRTDFRWVNKLFHYGKFTLGTNLSSMLLRSIDSFMLGGLLGPAAVAIYNPALRLANLLEIPTGTITTIVFPQIARRVKEHGLGEAKRLYEKSVGMVLAVMIPVSLLVIVFAEPIILLVAGEDYRASVPVLSITILYGLILPFNRQFGVTMNALGKAPINFYFVLSNALLNIIFNYFFISTYGIIGAPIGTLLAYVVGLIASEIILHRLMKVNVLNVFSYAFRTYVDAAQRIVSWGTRSTKQ